MTAVLILMQEMTIGHQFHRGKDAKLTIPEDEEIS